MTEKNKWLYPKDEQGKLEKGIVYEDITYSSEHIEMDDKFVVISKKSRKRRRKKEK